MADKTHDELDRVLDAVLAKYAEAEPRAGLEARVLANLRAERARVEDRTWWRWGLAAAALAVVVVTVALAWRSGRPSPPVVRSHPSAPTHVSKEPKKQVASNGVGNGVRPPRPGTAPTVTASPNGPIAIAQHPKLGQFPSPQPLSEQEKILQNYVAKYPEQAVLVARARSEELRRDQLEEMQAFPAGDPATNSEERNNDTTRR
jgi:hypothetical protein